MGSTSECFLRQLSAGIEGWPAEKSAQKLIAIDLADAAKLVVKP